MPLPDAFHDLKTLVLAGSNPAGIVPEGSEPPPEMPLVDKAFHSLHGRLVIDYVIDSLVACGLTRIWVLAPEHQLARMPGPRPFTAILQPNGAGFFDNVSTAAAVLQPARDEPILLVFGDHPLITTTALQAFLVGCSRKLGEADFFHALALQGAYRAYAPWFRRTSFHTREMSGRASGLSLVIPSRVHGLQSMQQLYAVRKLERLDSFLALLLHLMRWLGKDAPRAVLHSLLAYLAKEMEAASHGPGALAAVARRIESWAAARVPMGRLERYAALVLGAERGVRLVPVAHGGLAIDVDFAEELDAMERQWESLQVIAAEQDAALAGDTGTSTHHA